MTYINNSSAVGSSNIPSSAVPSGIAAGDDIFIAILFQDNTSTPSAWPSGFTTLTSSTDVSLGNKLWLGHKTASGSESGSFTTTMSGFAGWEQLVVVERIGTAIDDNKSSNNYAGFVNSGTPFSIANVSLTATGTNDTVLWFMATGSGGGTTQTMTITQPAGLTTQVTYDPLNVGYAIVFADGVQTANGVHAYGGSITSNASDSHGVQTIGLLYVGTPPVGALLSNTGSANIASTTASGTVTSNTSGGTIYCVACSSNTAPSNTQIKSGSGGTIVASGSISASSGVNSIPLTGLSISTTYYLFFIQNNGIDSNIPSSASFTTLNGVANLTSISANNIGSTTANVVVTSDKSGGTLYVVLTPSSTRPSNTQIIAGQDSGSTTRPSGNVSPGIIGINTIPVSGLTTSTTYFIQALQVIGGANSNASAANSFSTTATAPAVVSVSPTIPQNGANLTITGTTFNATQSNGIITIGGASQNVNSWNANTISVVVSRSNNKYGSNVSIIVTNGVSGLSSSPFNIQIQPQSGWSFIDIGTPDSNSSHRITATPDIVSGDQVAYDNVSNTVSVFSDATFSAGANVVSFNAEVWNTGNGWGSIATQTIGAATFTAFKVGRKIIWFT